MARQNGTPAGQQNGVVAGNGIPMGFKFHPTPLEVIQLFLFKKLLGLEILTTMIMELDVFEFDPDNLPMDPSPQRRTNEGYFFTPMENRNSRRRDTPTGYWLITKENVPVYNRVGEIVGFKNRLSFYCNGAVTDWRMSEYRCSLAGHEDVEEKYIVCKVRFKVKEDETVDNVDETDDFLEEDHRENGV